MMKMSPTESRIIIKSKTALYYKLESRRIIPPVVLPLEGYTEHMLPHIIR